MHVHVGKLIVAMYDVCVVWQLVHLSAWSADTVVGCVAFRSHLLLMCTKWPLLLNSSSFA